MIFVLSGPVECAVGSCIKAAAHAAMHLAKTHTGMNVSFVLHSVTITVTERDTFEEICARYQKGVAGFYFEEHAKAS